MTATTKMLRIILVVLQIASVEENDEIRGAIPGSNGSCW